MSRVYPMLKADNMRYTGQPLRVGQLVTLNKTTKRLEPMYMSAIPKQGATDYATNWTNRGSQTYV